MSTLIKGKGKQAGQFIEQDCTLKLDGKEFTSGGSYIAKNIKTGKLEGILYASPTTKEVTSWDGKLRIPAYFGQVFNSNSWNCRRQYCWFTYQGKKFVGINYSVDNQECINVREIKA